MRSTSTMVRGSILPLFLLMLTSSLLITGCGSTVQLGRVIQSVDTTYTVILPERIFEGNYVDVPEEDGDYAQTFEVEFVEKQADSPKGRVAARATITLPNPKNPEGKATLVLPSDSLKVKGEKEKETITVKYEPSWIEKAWSWVKQTGYLTVILLVLVGVFAVIAALRK